DAGLIDNAQETTPKTMDPQYRRLWENAYERNIEARVDQAIGHLDDEGKLYTWHEADGEEHISCVEPDRDASAEQIAAFERWLQRRTPAQARVAEAVALQLHDGQHRNQTPNRANADRRWGT
ncbi:MAG TPA: hypothetical protein VN797_03180, partial [Gemmatimonadaceae bacterium]|nr:hypothetical protein [Gemmatimonadaceae bacterium]